MSDASYICDGCKGRVAVPPYRRVTIEQVEAVHEPTCPGRLRAVGNRRQRKAEESTEAN